MSKKAKKRRCKEIVRARVKHSRDTREREGTIRSDGGGNCRKGRGNRTKERGVRVERTALLSASSNIPRATPGFSFARGRRRFCRLNAINDLIPVITVLIYRARGGSDFLWLCVGGSKLERGRREAHRRSGGGRKFLFVL